MHVYTEPLGMEQQTFEVEGFLIGKELIMHLPVFAPFARAVSSLDCSEGLFMNGLEGKVAENIFDLARLDILPLDLRQNFAEVTSAKGALVIGEFDQREFCASISSKGAVIDTKDNILGLG